MRRGRMAIDDWLGEAVPSPVPEPNLFLQNQSPYGKAVSLVEGRDKTADDKSNFRRLLGRLALEGRRYEKGDKLTEMLDGEKFSRVTKNIVSELVYIMEDHPELVGEVPV